MNSNEMDSDGWLFRDGVTFGAWGKVSGSFRASMMELGIWLTVEDLMNTVYIIAYGCIWVFCGFL